MTAINMLVFWIEKNSKDMKHFTLYKKRMLYYPMFQPKAAEVTQAKNK